MPVYNVAVERTEIVDLEVTASSAEDAEILALAWIVHSMGTSVRVRAGEHGAWKVGYVAEKAPTDKLVTDAASTTGFSSTSGPPKTYGDDTPSSCYGVGDRYMDHAGH